MEEEKEGEEEAAVKWGCYKEKQCVVSYAQVLKQSLPANTGRGAREGGSGGTRTESDSNRDIVKSWLSIRALGV